MEDTKDHMKVNTFITSLQEKMSKTFLSSTDFYSAAPYKPMPNQEVNSSYHYQGRSQKKLMTEAMSMEDL